VRKLHSEDYFLYLQQLPLGEVHIVQAERKYTNGFEFAAFFLYYHALDVHMSLPHFQSHVGSLAQTFTYVINDHLFYKYFGAFCMHQRRNGHPLGHTGTGTTATRLPVFHLTPYLTVKLSQSVTDLTLTKNIIGGMLNDEYDTLSPTGYPEMFAHLENRLLAVYKHFPMQHCIGVIRIKK